MIRNDPFIGSRNVYDIVVSGGVKTSFGSRRDQWNRGDPWFVDGFGHGIFDAVGFFTCIIMIGGVQAPSSS